MRRIIEHGALLMRGRGDETAEQFRAFSEALVGNLQDYVGGGSPRTPLGDRIYTSTEYPAQQHIMLHIEGSYLLESPRIVLFFCDTPPTDRGQTPIGDMAEVYDSLPAELRDRFESLGVEYRNVMHGGKGFGKTWQATFMSEDRAHVESLLAKDGYEFAWDKDGSLTTSIRRPGVATHTDSGRKVWWNQAVNWHPTDLDEKTRAFVQRHYGDAPPKLSCYGDGATISDDDANLIRRTLIEHERKFEWRRGDLLVCDNHRIAHGREPFTGDRRILVAMG